jgi:protocatechuate 3,4-dioxygenase beta subunit
MFDLQWLLICSFRRRRGHTMRKAMLIEVLHHRHGWWPRRRVLQAGGLALVGMTAGIPLQGAAQEALPPTPQCDGGKGHATPRQTAGPFYTPNTPQRASLLEAGTKGTPITVTGMVLNTRCEPLAGALLDFWQADADGVYDNEGYTMRGHQFTDAKGQYRLETVMPGLYPGRTRHLHVNVQAPHGQVLTTQLYFPNEAGNTRDAIFDERLVMAMPPSAANPIARFDFVLPG